MFFGSRVPGMYAPFQDVCLPGVEAGLSEGIDLSAHELIDESVSRACAGWLIPSLGMTGLEEFHLRPAHLSGTDGASPFVVGQLGRAPVARRGRERVETGTNFEGRHCMRSTRNEVRSGMENRAFAEGRKHETGLAGELGI